MDVFESQPQPTQRGPEKEPLNINSLLGVLTASLSLAAALVTVFGDLPLWVTILIVVGMFLLVTIVGWKPLASWLSNKALMRRRNKQIDALIESSSRVVGRLLEQAEMTRSDSLPSTLSELHNAIATEAKPRYFVPNPVALAMGIEIVGDLIRQPRLSLSSKLYLFRLSDILFGVFHEHHVYYPATVVDKVPWPSSHYQLDNVRRAWQRYFNLVDEHRKNTLEVNRDFGEHCAVWCSQIPSQL